MAYWTTYAAASSATGRSWHTDFLRGEEDFLRWTEIRGMGCIRINMFD